MFDSFGWKMFKRSKLWWLDHCILHHRIRLICQFDLWRGGMSWKKAGRLVCD